jgi:hypothetical protein
LQGSRKRYPATTYLFLDLLTEEYQLFKYGTTSILDWDLAAVEFQANLADLHEHGHSVVVLVYGQESALSVLQKLGVHPPNTRQIGLHSFL